MADDATEPSNEDVATEALPRRKRRGRALAVLALLLLVALAAAWIARKRIADDLIAQQLETLDLPATYKVEKIGTGKQVLRDLVFGDPKKPDLTVERAEVETVLRLGMPQIGRITLIKPRLYGAYRGGKLSFGSLDPILFTGSKEPFRLPDYDIAIVDGRGLLDSDYGPVGLKIEGAGHLRDGFAGTLAAVAPSLDLAGCRGKGATLFGKLAVTGETPRFNGPLRFAGLSCPEQKLALGKSAVQIDATFDKALDGAEGQLAFEGSRLAMAANRIGALDGKARFAFRQRALTLDYDLAAATIATPQAGLARLGLEGVLRSQDMFARLETEASFKGEGLTTGDGLDKSLAGLEATGAGTLAQPLLAKLRAALRREQAGNRMAGAFIARSESGKLSVVVPQAALRGGSGQVLLGISRLQLTVAEGRAPRLAGNFATGGEGIPQATGRMELTPGGGFTAKLAMADYSAGDSMLGFPELMLVQSRSGAMGFAGRMRLNGDLPVVSVRNMELPLKGDWTPGGGLAVWRECTPVRFDSLKLADLTIDRRDMALCPPRGGAVLASDARGARFALGLPALSLSGRLGSTPVRIASGPLGFAAPGSLTSKKLDIALGAGGNVSRFSIANLSAKVGSDIAGRFAGADVTLDAVPLDIREAAGSWRYANGRLSIANAGFELLDREVEDRFKPLVTEAAVLSLANNRIAAEATMLEPASRRAVVRVTLAHDLGAGRGSADLAVDGIVFDKQVQPDTLTPLALGVVANAEGVLRGTGRIDWNPRTVTSTGTFSTEDMDFAAAFGPVHGLAGTVRFTDLLGMVTAPAQKVTIASINPGIEVNDGEIVFEMQPGQVFVFEGGYWPFLDGSLVLDPARMAIGSAETRRLTLHVEGLDAAKFIEKMDLGNISATGIFDGKIPLVFDEDGGKIEQGRLVSRPPGGNVSYVGELTYQDMSTMANFAFDALRSIDYRQMRIELDGSLAGEMVTRVNFEGIRQGKGTRRNFITNQIAKLPIQFKVNIRAPFFSMVTNLRSIYDPNYLRDPRTLGVDLGDGKSAGVQPPVSGTSP